MPTLSRNRACLVDKRSGDRFRATLSTLQTAGGSSLLLDLLDETALFERRERRAPGGRGDLRLSDKVRLGEQHVGVPQLVENRPGESGPSDGKLQPRGRRPFDGSGGRREESELRRGRECIAGTPQRRSLHVP